MVGAEAKKMRVIEAEDLISSLPDPILGAIISLLPSNEGVRTCVLSQRWKTMWKHASHLNFDLTHMLKPFMQTNPCKLYPKTSHDPAFNRRRRAFNRRGVDPYKDNEKLDVIAKEERLINLVLDSHFGLLESCSVKYSTKCVRGKAVLIKKLLQEKKVKKLSIEKHDNVDLGFITILDFPFEIFSAGFEALELKNCYLKTEPLNVCARVLRTLTFKKVLVAKNIWNEILSCCLCLENLTLDDCKLMEVVKIDIPRLKFFRICRMVMSEIVVSAVNLEIFEMDNVVCKTQNLTIEAPKVHVLRSCGDSKIGVQYVCWLRSILLQLGNTPHIHSSNQTLQGSTTKFAGTFENVTTVCIDLDLKRDKNVIALFLAIKFCPKLQNLEINSQVNGDVIDNHINVNNEDYLPYPTTLFWTNRELRKCVDHRIKTLSIKGFVGEELEVEFLKYMITTVDVMKKITVWFVDDCSWTQAIQTRCLLLFPKASPNLSIILYPGPIYMANVDDNFETWVSTLRNWSSC